MMDTLKLCVSCKAYRHECPTGVDMAKMKIEVLAARMATHGLSLRDRLVGYLPHYAALASCFAPLANLRNRSSLLGLLLEKIAGISAKRALPAFRRDAFNPQKQDMGRPAAARWCFSLILLIEPTSAKTSTPHFAC
jgi:Fe-S oxidoreductase